MLAIRTSIEVYDTDDEHVMAVAESVTGVIAPNGDENTSVADMLLMTAATVEVESSRTSERLVEQLRAAMDHAGES